MKKGISSEKVYMRQAFRVLLAASIAFIFILQSGCSLLREQGQSDFVDIDTQQQRRGTGSVLPQTKPDGSAFTLAYVDIDPFPTTGETFYYLIMGLREEGWIFFDTLPFDPADTDAGALVDWLAGQDIGPYIRFDSNANYYTAFQSEDYIRDSLAEHVNNGTIDILLTMGTSPAAMVRRFDLEIPHMIFGTIDPIGSGLIESLENSGNPLVWAVLDPTRFERQLLYYYDLIPFTNMGIVYYDENVASLHSYEKVTDSLGVNMTRSKITRVDASTEESIENYYTRLGREFKRLVEDVGVDAFMLTTDIIIDSTRTAGLLEVFTENGIPVFVQVGEGFVRDGALMNVSAFESEGLGIFGARSITQALSGTPLYELSQEFGHSPYLTINLDIAERIGFRPTFEMLLASENIFTSSGRE